MSIALLALISAKTKFAASWLLRLARDHPWPLAVAAALVLAWFQWDAKRDALEARDQARTSLKAEKDGRKSDQAAWQLQVANAKAQTAAAESKSKEIATDAQASHDALLADNAGLRDYIAAHRLRIVPSPGTAVTAGAARDFGAGLPPAGAAGTFVATAETDLVTCNADYAYALGAHQFIQELMAGGLAK